MDKIAELKEYVNNLDQRIAQCRNAEKPVANLIRNKGIAIETIATLEEAEQGNTIPLHGLR